MKQRRHPGKRSSRHRSRLFILQGLGLIGLGAVAWRLAFVQHSFGPTLLAQAARNDTVNGPLLAPRGALLDDQGHLLAYDVPAYIMDINLQPLQANLTRVASIIASATGDTTARALTRLSGYHSWIEWPHPVQEPAKERIATAIARLSTKSVGDLVTFTPTEQRVYPNGVFASNVIGYINSLNVGQTGLEAQYNAQLTGHDGEYSYTVQANGFPVESTYKTTQPAKPGEDVQVTLDQTIQGFVEQKMNTLVNQYHPARAAIIVMRPQTGAILAMTSRPTFNPNAYQSASATALEDNWAVNDRFEPGSTFKPIVLAAALATHKITLNQTFMSGQTTVDGYQINDWNWGIGWGRLSFLGALEKSSNVGFSKIARKLGWPDLLDYMGRFGYLNPTGIDLPNEASSIVFAPNMQGPLQLATSGFGQGIAVTPLQQMAAIAAIANGGTLYKPYVAAQLMDSSTHRVVTRNRPTVIRRHVVPPDVAAAVNQAMIDDVNSPAGIDKVGYLKGYDLAGKTGTAQVPNTKTGGYYNNRFIVSFIGYAPGWDPQFEVYVTLDWPKTPIGNTWGSTLAGPAARDILQDCLQYYHIQPRNSSVTLKGVGATIPTGDQTSYLELPNLKGLTISQATAAAQKLGLATNVVGGGVKVTVQWPQAGTEVVKGSAVYVAASAADGGKRGVTMPNLVGAPMRLAGDVLATLGLSMQPVGTGFVVQQSIPPGRVVAKGSAVTLTLSPTN